MEPEAAKRPLRSAHGPPGGTGALQRGHLRRAARRRQSRMHSTQNVCLQVMEKCPEVGVRCKQGLHPAWSSACSRRGSAAAGECPHPHGSVQGSCRVPRHMEHSRQSSDRPSSPESSRPSIGATAARAATQGGAGRRRRWRRGAAVQCSPSPLWLCGGAAPTVSGACRRKSRLGQHSERPLQLCSPSSLSLAASNRFNDAD